MGTGYGAATTDARAGHQMLSWTLRCGRCALAIRGARFDDGLCRDATGAACADAGRAARMPHTLVAGSPLGVPGDLARLSVGIATVDDVTAGSDQALR